MKESDDGEQPQRVYAAAAMVEDDAMDYIGGWDEDEGRFEDDWSDFEYDDDAAYEDDEFEGAFDYGLQNDDEDGYNADEGYEDYVDAYDAYEYEAEEADEYEYEEDYAEYDDEYAFDFLSNGGDASSSLATLDDESAEFGAGFLWMVALSALLLFSGIVCCAAVGLRRRRRKKEPSSPEQQYQQQALAMSDTDSESEDDELRQHEDPYIASQF